MSTTYYINGFQYFDNVLQFFPTPEGYVKNTPMMSGGYSFDYVYNYLDHLGNIRLSYTQDPQTGILAILEENHYYPFGLQHKNYNSDITKIDLLPEQNNEKGLKETAPPTVPLQNPGYMYKYNGKELQNEFGVNFYDFGARNYMPDLGRWSNMDPLSEKYYKSSNYHYAANNPVFYIDPDGMRIDVSGILARNKDGEYKNKELAEAFLTFANSDFGREILGMFADAGQKIEGTDIEFGESGIFAQQGLDLHVDMSSQNHTKGNDDERQTDTGANGSTAFSFNTKTGRGAVAIYMNSDLNTGSNEYAKAFKENPNDPDARQLFILSRTGTLFHEATIHVIPRTQDFFDDCNVNSSNIIQSILNQTRSVSRQDHLQAREEGSMFRTRAIPAMQQLHREKKTGLSNKKVESIMLNYSNQ